jgi:Fe2+ or Zn2+ uptake regulation protein
MITFACSECGRIGDFYSEALDRFPVPREVAEMGSVDGIHVELRGRCRGCQEKARKRKPKQEVQP